VHGMFRRGGRETSETIDLCRTHVHDTPFFTHLHVPPRDFCYKNGAEAVSRGTSFKKHQTSATSARSKNLKEVTQAEISRGGFRLVIPECAGFSHLPGRV